MTTTSPSEPSPWGSAPASDDEATAVEDLDEQLCQVQADMLEMGRDNYERLCRVCPDPQRRYRVLRGRIDRQIQLALAASVPRWRSPNRPRFDAAATSTAAAEMWFDLDTRGESVRQTHIALDAADGDGFSPGRPPDAELCWCCDLRNAASDIGLCTPCHGALRSR